MNPWLYCITVFLCLFIYLAGVSEKAAEGDHLESPYIFAQSVVNGSGEGSESSQGTEITGRETSSGEGMDKRGSTSEESGSRDPGGKSLSPFKPSERITADQAIDFPWDI
jgi:hypothetical protein